MRIFRIAFTLLLLAAFSQVGSAQSYKSAIGARLGYPLSLSYKTFVSESTAVEGILGYRGFSGYSWITIGAALQKHNAIGDVDGLSWYYGGGASVFLFNFDNDFFGDNSSTTSFGIQGYLGLDYRFADIPLNLSVDWVPTFFVNGFGSGFGGGYGALAARYILGE